MEKIIYIEGMSCGHCQKHVEDALNAIQEVDSAIVDLENKTATVTLNNSIDNDVLIAAVKDAGYEPKSIEDLK